MTRQEIIYKLTPIAREAFQNEELVLSDELSAENVDSWNSLAFMKLLTAIETDFGFKFKMMELIQLNTMGDILDAMEKHLA